MFRYASYWGRWSRVLSDSHPQGPFVEVNLTPVGNRHSHSWVSDVAPIRIRAHGTAPDRSDKLVSELPPDIKSHMVTNLGEQLTERLLTEDFLSQIDWELYRKRDNAGARLEDIKASESVEATWKSILNACSHPRNHPANKVQAMSTKVDPFKGAYVDICGPQSARVPARILCNHLVPGWLNPEDPLLFEVTVLSADRATGVVRVSHTDKLNQFFASMKIGQKTSGYVTSDSGDNYIVTLVDCACRAVLPKKLAPTPIPFHKEIHNYLEGLTIHDFNPNNYHLVVSALSPVPR